MLLAALSAAVLPLVPASGILSASTSPQLLRYPYLTDVTTSSALVNFATDTPSPAAVITFGPAGFGCAAASATATAATVTVGGNTEYQFKATITGLNASTPYCYRVVQGGVDLLGGDPSPTFTSAMPSGAGGPYSFAVLGDWGAGSAGEASVLSQVANGPASFVVSVGDNAYDTGTQTDYGDLRGGNVFAPSFWKQVGASKPAFFAQGNHGFTANTSYLQNWPEDATVQASGGKYRRESYCCIATMPGSNTYASAWYAFDWGNARFYVLEAAWADGTGDYQGDFLAHWNDTVSGCTPCGTELQWLQADLAAHASTPLKFAFFHYPLYADSSSQPSDAYLDGPSRLEGLLARNGVDIVFNGHAHQYERNRPQIPGSPMVSYVTGGGGGLLGSVGGCSSFDAYAVGSGSSCNAPRPASDAQVFHHLLVTVNGGQVTVTPIDATGRPFDVQTYTFGIAPPPPPPPPPPPSWSFETLDSAGTVGQYSAVTLYGGLPHVFYYDATNGDLRHAWWTGAQWAFETLDSAGTVGQYNAVTLFNGLPHVWYYDSSHGDLRHAWWTGVQWSFETLDSAGTVGQYNAVTLFNGVPHVWYYDSSHGDLRHAWFG